jgi:hypothetical protein
MAKSSTPVSKPAPPTVTQILKRSFTSVERTFVSAAEEMAEDKYQFAPTKGEFVGVRTFAQQVMHVAVNNYNYGRALLGEKPPLSTQGQNENGPPIKSKAEIVKYLKGSFAYAYKALATVTDRTATELLKGDFAPGVREASRLRIAIVLISHPYDHYGQIVEYLRMNGILPPPSRPGR